MTKSTVLWELWHTLTDAARCGDLRGHLMSWWEVITGAVSVG